MSYGRNLGPNLLIEARRVHQLENDDLADLVGKVERIVRHLAEQGFIDPIPEEALAWEVPS